MTRTQPAPPRVDFHCALLWVRSLEIVTGRTLELSASDPEMHELFARYRSPWRA